MFNSLPTYKKVGLIASLIGTVLMTGGFALTCVIPGASRSGSFIGGVIAVFIVIGFIATVVSYATGGLIEAIKSALHVGKWGWLLMSFPVDIFTGLISTIAAFYILVAFPIYPVYKSCKKYLETHIVVENYYF
ncbi:MAG: hypothetical protein J5819_02605 [Eubacterium sp.]|nr:hypothetical protein [Eubacterium sp.]